MEDSVAGGCLAVFRLASGGSLRVPPEHRRFLAITAVCVFGIPYALVYLGARMPRRRPAVADTTG